MNQSTQPLATTRSQLLERLAQTETFDLAVVGGGATGLGVAVDAAARGRNRDIKAVFTWHT